MMRKAKPVSDGKSAILGRLRRSLHATSDGSITRGEAKARLERKEKGVLPARAELDHEAQIELFLSYSKMASCTNERIACYDDFHLEQQH